MVIALAAAGMKKAGVEAGQILTSPYRRARQTAEVVAAALGLRDHVELLPEMASGARWTLLHAALLAYQDLSSLLLVGHQPDLSELAAGLLGGGPAVSFAPASMARFEVDGIPPRGVGSLVWCRRAEDLARLDA